MKHLEAGLIVGGVALGLVAVMAVAWAFLNFLVGPLAATIALLLVALIATMVVIVDWKTEKPKE